MSGDYLLKFLKVILLLSPFESVKYKLPSKLAVFRIVGPQLLYFPQFSITFNVLFHQRPAFVIPVLHLLGTSFNI
jgi:hypothetical protein